MRQQMDTISLHIIAMRDPARNKFGGLTFSLVVVHDVTFLAWAYLGGDGVRAQPLKNNLFLVLGAHFSDSSPVDPVFICSVFRISSSRP